MGIHINLLPEVFFHLRVEIEKHQALKVLLHNQPDKDLYIQLSEIAAYCMIPMDGTYTRAEIIEVAEQCLRILQKASSPIILLS